MKSLASPILVLALTLVSVTPAFAQTDVAAAPAPKPVTLAELALRDGSRLYGSVLTEKADEVVFRTQSGTVVTVRRADILTLEQVSGVIIGEEFARADPNTTRLFFGPTGRSLRRGQAYLGMYEFLLPFVQIGVTDRISVGGGTPLVFGEGTGNRPFWITPKVQLFDGARTQLSVGVFHGFAPGGEGGGIAYVVATHGSVASSFTVGVGTAYSNDGGQAGVLMVGGERQVRRNVKLVSENYIWKNGRGIVSGGVRVFGDRLSADLALLVPLADTFFAAPLVNFVYIF